MYQLENKQWFIDEHDIQECCKDSKLIIYVALSISIANLIHDIITHFSVTLFGLR